MAKISYIEKENASPEISALYDQIQGKLGLVPNVVKAIANSPVMLQGFMPFLGAALGPTAVDAPLKELAIITTSKLNGCNYCTTHHVVAGKRAGLSLDKINATPDFNSSLFDDREKAVVRFAKEVTKDISASDESIRMLQNHFDNSQIAELTMVIGVFNVLTRFADTFKVDLEF